MFSVPKPDACKPLYPATTLPPSLLPLLRSSTRRAESDTVGPLPLFSDSFGQASSLCSRVFGASGMLLQGSQYAGNLEARRHTQTCINLQEHSLNRTSTAAVSHDSLHMHTPDKTRIKAFCSEPARISRLYTVLLFSSRSITRPACCHMLQRPRSWPLLSQGHACLLHLIGNCGTNPVRRVEG